MGYNQTLVGESLAGLDTDVSLIEPDFPQKIMVYPYGACEFVTKATQKEFDPA